MHVTEPRNVRYFNFGINNRLSKCRLCDATGKHTGWWISGRVLGFYISYAWPLRGVDPATWGVDQRLHISFAPRKRIVRRGASQ